MDFRLFLMKPFGTSFNNSGDYISRNWTTNHVSPFRKSNIFNTGFLEKLFFIMLIMNKPN